MDNKEILLAANKAVTNGDNEGFLNYCTDDTEWTFVGDGDITLKGKETVRQWMTENYIVPPDFDVKTLIAENDFVTAIGTIKITSGNSKNEQFEYCDIWQFQDGKMAKLKAFVIESKR